MPFIFIWMLIEIAVFLLVGKLIGVLWTLLAIAFTTLLGLAVLRSQSLAMVKKMHETVRQGKGPLSLNSDMPYIMLAGMLLLIPGFITDVIGLLLLIPAVPGLLLRGNTKSRATNSDQDRIIDGEYWESDQKKDSHHNKKEPQ